MTDDPLFSREEVLGGLPARRAAALLFLIESRTAHLVDRARHAMTPFRTEDDERQRELAFVEAFALGRKPPLRPSIQDLERHAAEWADLVPDNPRMRAAVAHLLGGKYQFTVTEVPGIRAALGLDTDSVQQAFARLYSEPLDTVYIERPSLIDRLRWTRASLSRRLESLPPFWTTYSLTVTETIGSGILALPIAVAFVGPVPAIMMLILMGLINVVTVAWMAESVTRTASIRYGGAFFGRMVKEYLGGAGAILLTIALLINSVVGLLAYSVGLSGTLESMTGVTPVAWLVLVFGVTWLVTTRGSMASSVASAIGIGGVNLALLLVLVMLGFLHMTPGNLSHMALPGVGGQPLDPSLLGLIFGALLIAYFGHTSVGSCASVVLRRDPGARSLIRGVIAAQLTTIAVYSIWILGINGALSPDMLTDEAGTVLEPLATVAGPSVYVAGSAFVILAMGTGMTGKAGTLMSVIHEWFPSRAHPIVMLPRRQARLLFEPRRRDLADGSGIALTYLGLRGDQPRFRLQGQASGRTWRADHVGAGTWMVRDVLTGAPDDVLAGDDLTITCLSADEGQVRLQVSSGMRIHYEGSWTAAGLDLAGLIDLDGMGASADAESDLLRWMLRQGKVSLADAAAWAGYAESEMRPRLRGLVDRGAVRELQENGVTVYRANMARRRTRHVPDGLHPEATSLPAPTARVSNRARAVQAVGWLRTDRGRRMLEFGPLVAIALLTEWLVITDRASFTGLLSFSGTIAVPVFTGLFPPLLLLSSRRKGDLVPEQVSRLLGRPWLAAGFYAFFLVAMLLHGLFVWQNPLAQAMLLAFVAISLTVTVLSIRGGAFAGRTVVTLREERSSGGAVFQVVSSGVPVQADVRLAYGEGDSRVGWIDPVIRDFASLSKITTTLPPGQEREVKIWANQVSPQGDLQRLPAKVRLVGDPGPQSIDLGLSGGTALLPREATPCVIEIELDQPSLAGAVPPRTKRVRTPPVDMHALLATSPGDTRRSSESGR